MTTTGLVPLAIMERHPQDGSSPAPLAVTPRYPHGVPEISPLSRQDADWLRELLAATDEHLAAAHPIPPFESADLRAHQAAMDVARRALRRHDARPRWLQWKQPRRPRSDEVTLLAWAEDIEALNQRAMLRIKHDEGATGN